MNPDRYNHSHLVFLHFLVTLSEISFLGYMHRTLTWTLKAMPHCTYMICSIPIFFLIFLILFSFETPEFPFLDIYPGLCKHQPTILITIPIFFIIFSLFFKAISIQNCKCFHIWICTLDPENSTPSPQTPSPTILYFFIIFFLFYSYFFTYHSNPLHIWKCALDPENSTPSPPTPSPTIPYLSLIFAYFIAIFHLVCYTFHIWKYATDPDTIEIHTRENEILNEIVPEENETDMMKML